MAKENKKLINMDDIRNEKQRLANETVRIAKALEIEGFNSDMAFLYPNVGFELKNFSENPNRKYNIFFNAWTFIIKPEDIQGFSSYARQDKILIINDALTSLPIELFRLQRLEIKPESVEILTAALKDNTSLTSFSSEGLWKDNTNAFEMFAGALNTKHSLKFLSLYDEVITADGAEVLIKALKDNKSLTNIHLNWCQMGKNEADLLADFIKVNPFIKTLDIQNNPFTSEGFTSIINSLGVNKNLTSISLGGTFGPSALKEKELIEFAKKLATNVNLTQLVLDCNAEYLTQGAANEIKKALTVNHTLLDFIFNFARMADENFIKKIIENKNLSTVCEGLLSNNIIVNFYTQLQDKALADKITTKIAGNRLKVHQLAGWLDEKFNFDKEVNFGPNFVERIKNEHFIKNLKFYQVADKALLQEYMGSINCTYEEKFEEFEQRVDQIIAKNFHWLSGICKSYDDTAIYSIISNIFEFIGPHSLWHAEEAYEHDNNVQESIELSGNTNNPCVIA